MCFMPFLATATAPTVEPLFQQHSGTFLFAVHHCPPADLADKFSLPHHAEIGLIMGCGCWLRNLTPGSPGPPAGPDFDQPSCDPIALLLPHPQGPGVPEEIDQEGPTACAPEMQANHDGLADYLCQHFRQDRFVEFYGCWAGDTAKPPTQRRQLPLDIIRHPLFHFYSGTVYRFTFAE